MKYLTASHGLFKIALPLTNPSTIIQTFSTSIVAFAALFFVVCTIVTLVTLVAYFYFMVKNPKLLKSEELRTPSARFAREAERPFFQVFKAKSNEKSGNTSFTLEIVVRLGLQRLDSNLW